MAILDNSKKVNQAADETIAAKPANEQAPDLGYGPNSDPAQPHTILGTSNATSGLDGLTYVQDLFNNVLPTSSSNGLVKAYMDTFNEMYQEMVKSQANTMKFEFLPMHMERNDLPYSSIVVMHPCVYKGQKAVSVHTVMLEDTGALPEPQRITFGGVETVEVPTTAGDCHDKQYTRKVAARVHQHYGENIIIVDAGFSVIYNTVDETDRQAVTRVLTMATNATVGATKLESREDLIREGHTLAKIFKDNGLNLTARVDTAPSPRIGANGLRARRDMAVTTSVASASTQNNMRQAGGRGLMISEVSLFTTLEYTMPEVPQYNPLMTPQQMQMYTPTQRYIPRAVITDISTSGFPTLPSILLGISSATVIQEGVLWMENFRPKSNRKSGDIDIRDIGAIGWDIPELNADGERGKIDTTTKSFTTDDFHKLMAATVTPNVIYSIDIEEAGPLSWLMYVFINASKGVASAKRSIIEACDSLTDNNFSRHFSPQSDILRSDGNRVMLGTYIDGQTNEVRDIRDIDYLAILNLVGQDAEIVADFERTQHDTGANDLAARIALQRELLENLLGSSMQIKGYAQRFTFHNDFIQALAVATREAGVAPRFQNLPQTQQLAQRRRMENYNWAMVSQQQMTAAASMYMNANQGQAGYGMPIMPSQNVWVG